MKEIWEKMGETLRDDERGGEIVVRGVKRVFFFF